MKSRSRHNLVQVNFLKNYPIRYKLKLKTKIYTPVRLKYQQNWRLKELQKTHTESFNLHHENKITPSRL